MPAIELYFAPGACSFVPHVALEIIKSTTGQDFEPRMVKIHKGENATPEYLAMNPNGQVPVMRVDGKTLTQIVAICDWLDRSFPKAGFLPTEQWARTQALSQLAWMNNTVHPSFTHIFLPHKFAETEAGKADIRKVGTAQFRLYLDRIQGIIKDAKPFWFGERLSFHDAYAFSLLRWGGYAGIDPKSLPAYHAYVERVTAVPEVAAAMARERIALDTYKPAG
jgi:glutathione S-transferase